MRHQRAGAGRGRGRRGMSPFVAILGKPADEFARYDAAIRQEYAWVSAEAYRAGRSKVLQSFLDRDRIYQTEFFRNRYEEKARENLQRVIKRLK